jgi:hypothetical protein
MREHPEVAILGAWITMIDANGVPISTNMYHTDPKDIRAGLLAHRGVMAHTATTMRKDVIVAAGGYRPQFDFALDYDLWLRVSERSDLANLPEVLALYRLHAGQVSQRFWPWQQALAELAIALAARRKEARPDPIEAGLTAEAAMHLLQLPVPEPPDLARLADPTPIR